MLHAANLGAVLRSRAVLTIEESFKLGRALRLFERAAGLVHEVCAVATSFLSMGATIKNVDFFQRKAHYSEWTLDSTPYSKAQAFSTHVTSQYMPQTRGRG